MPIEMMRMNPTEPKAAEVGHLTVKESYSLGSNFQRIVFTADELISKNFEYMGYDQWMRLFFPINGELVVPLGRESNWYLRYLKLSKKRRSIIRNYTIQQAWWENQQLYIAIDFVLHPTSGEAHDPAANVEITGPAKTDITLFTAKNSSGIAAAWAAAAIPGMTIGALDQGIIFNIPENTNRILLLSDETGVPGLEGITRSLSNSKIEVSALIEVPNIDDMRELYGAKTTWFQRNNTVGEQIITSLKEASINENTYVYLVGEASFVSKTKKELAAIGLPKAMLNFCPYWTASRKRRRKPTQAKAA